MSTALVILIFVLSAWAFVLWRALRRPHVPSAEAFAELYDVTLTDRSRAVLEATLERSRRFRYAGAVVVAIGYAMVERDAGLWSLLGAVAVGFAVGSIFDETTRPRESSRSAGAVLDRRSIFSFVERWVVVGLTVAVGAVVAICFILIRLDHARIPGDSSTRVPDQAVSIAWIVGVSAAAIFSAALLRRLVRLPAGGSTNDLLAVRHALRMASVLTVVGAMFVIVGFIGLRLGEIAMLSDGSRRTALRWASNIATFISALAIVGGLSLSLRALPRTIDRPASSAGSHASPTTRPNAR